MNYFVLIYWGLLLTIKSILDLKCLKSDESNLPLTFIFIAKTLIIKSNQKRFFLQFHFLEQEISVSLIQKENFSDWIFFQFWSSIYLSIISVGDFEKDILLLTVASLHVFSVLYFLIPFSKGHHCFHYRTKIINSAIVFYLFIPVIFYVENFELPAKLFFIKTRNVFSTKNFPLPFQ